MKLKFTNCPFSFFFNKKKQKDTQSNYNLDSRFEVLNYDDSISSLKVTEKDIESAFYLSKGEVRKYNGKYITFSTESDLEALRQTIKGHLILHTEEMITLAPAYGKNNTLKITGIKAFEECISNILKNETNSLNI